MSFIKSAVAVGLVSACLASAGFAEPLPVAKIRESVDHNIPAAVSLYREFLGLPNDAQHTDDIEQLNIWVEQAFSERGFSTRRVETAGNPALYAERLTDPTHKTVLVYLQADGQPVDPLAWDQANPFLAVLKEQAGDGSWAEIPLGKD